jgi:SPP1 gp7 family putative phage head morphogenesis protein
MQRNFKNLFGLLGNKEEKTVPRIDPIIETTRDGISKAYIPKFLYKPPFGYPRFVDLPNVRRLASTPYVDMCITAIVDEMCSIPWDIVAEDAKGDPIEGHDSEIEHVMTFFQNPNTNKESFTEIRRKYLRDILEVDAGVINKVFNAQEEMVEIVARDGATFTKNPDIYGMFTDRDDFIFDAQIINKPKEFVAMEPGYITTEDAREKAAYFQYGWITGARPVPFGKRELVWMERHPRTDSIYGRSPVEILADTIQTLIYAIESDLEYFNDNSIPKGVLGFENSDTNELEGFKDQWTEQQRVKDTAGNWKKAQHRLPMMNKVPIFTRIQFTNQEMQLLESQRWWAKLVWACFGVTAVELGYTEDAKGLANQIVQSNVFRKRAINPLLELEEYKINKEIISEFGYKDIKFKFLRFDVEEETKKANLYKLQLDAGVKTINEVRNEEGLDDLEWGDKEPNQNQGFNPFDPNQQEMNRRKEESQDEEEEKKKKKKKEQEAEKKAIETKPFGEYDNFDACVRANQDKSNPEAYCSALHKKITGKYPSEKAAEENPLILRENEVIDDDRLKRSIIYLLRQNEKSLIELLTSEKGQNILQEVKAVDDVIKRIKELVTFQGLKRVSDAAIQHTFMKGWDTAEKQLDRNFVINKDAITYLQNYTFNNIQDMTEEIKNDLRAELERGIIAGEGITNLTKRVKSVFDKGENRAEMIARTETNRAENQGLYQAFKSTGEAFVKRWIAAKDDRTSPICMRLHGQTVGLNDNFKDKQAGWEGPVPPAHVNCRSTVVYISKDELEKKTKEEEQLKKDLEEKVEDKKKQEEKDALQKKVNESILEVQEKKKQILEHMKNGGD